MWGPRVCWAVALGDSSWGPSSPCAAPRAGGSGVVSDRLTSCTRRPALPCKGRIGRLGHGLESSSPDIGRGGLPTSGSILWKSLQSLRRWNPPVHDGTLHTHRSSGVVRRDPTITFFPAGHLESPPGLVSTFGTPEGSISTGSPLVGVACCAAACLSGSASCTISTGGHWMQSASCSSSRKGFSSSVPESSIRVTAMMTFLFSDILLCPSSAVWDGSPDGPCPSLSILPRPNHAAGVSLHLPTPGHLNSGLAVKQL